MKSIKQKLILCFALLLIVTSVSNLAIGIFCANKSINITVNDDLKSVGTVAEVAIVNAIDKYKAIIKNVATQDYYFNDELTEDEKATRLKADAEQNGYLSLSFFDAHGKSISSDNASHKTIATSDNNFTTAMSGDVVMTSTALDTAGERFVFLYCPVEQGNRSGVLVAKLDCQTYSNIIKDITVNKSGNVFMLDEKGTSLANKNQTIVAEGANRIEQSKTDSSLVSTAKVFSKMIAGETGIDRYSINGAERICYYMPIQGTDGWSVGVVAPTKEMTSSISFTVFGLLTSSIVFVIVGIIIALKISNSIANPIHKMSQRILALSEGDLSSEVEEVKNKDEIGVLNQSLIKTIHILRNYISEISEILGKISNGNLDTSTQYEYVGEFAEIKNSMEKISSSLSETMVEILSSSEQVSSGSEQVANGAQALSQGATEQASALEELSASIEDISARVKENASNASLAKSASNDTQVHVNMGSDQMQELFSAMTEISNTSSNINRIIKTIEDIAFQTNILALNAAVEAARAGSAGKGFAVVADEVRNLANKSATAAKDTTMLIESAITAIDNGKATADQTAATLNQIVEGTKKSVELINQIADATNDQANAISQVTLGIEQVSAVVQTNSATAEESAAASEELSAQAGILNNLIGKFKVKSEYNSFTSHTSYADSTSNISDEDKYLSF